MAKNKNMKIINYFSNIKFWKIITIIILTAWYSFFIIRPLNLTHGDLGRHLKNGEIVLSSINSSYNFQNFLNTNFYSYTFPNYFFVNHHWGGGLIFYLLWNGSGFLGLQISIAVLIIFTFFIFFNTAYKQSDFWIASAVSFFLIPLISDRWEIRPEIFSYFFLGLFFWLLYRYRDNIDYGKILYILPILFAFWVNTHVYFVLGIALLGIFFIDAIFTKSKERIKKILLIFILCILTGLINPFGIKIYQYPFTLVQSQVILIQELTPLSQASPAVLNSAKALTFKIAFFAFWILYGYILISGKNKRSKLVVLLALLFSYFGWRMIRNLTISTLFFLPLLSIAISDFINLIIKEKIEIKKIKLWKTVGIVGLVFITIFINRHRIPIVWNIWATGQAQEQDNAALFILDNKIQGPLFNDFNSGGYSIFYLYPSIKPFIDNRPEAYPSSFLTDTYRQMRIDENIWDEANKKYDFNVLLLSLNRISSSASSFIVRRIEDPGWIPVFFDKKYFIIFIKNNEKNKDIIQKYEIPKSDLDIVQE